MFEAQVYIHRRERLRSAIGSGLILLLGNDESPINSPGITYPFRQDSSFLYFFGLIKPGLSVLIDYRAVEKYRHFGGIRIEDDILVQKKGGHILGPPIPKTIADIEAIMSTDRND